LRVPRLAAAVEDVIPLFAIGAVEDSRKRFYEEGLGLVCGSGSRKGTASVFTTYGRRK
jgi:hypothetical protein